MNTDFTVKTQWKLFLERAGLPSEDVLPPNQRREMRRAFYGGAAQILIMMRDVTSAYSEKEAGVIYKNILAEIMAYWENEQANQKGKI